jgi:NDP-sugar pyrophosphorylase family protein
MGMGRGLPPEQLAADLLPGSRTRVVVLAGGKGTRLAPMTAVLPKPLVPLGVEPVIAVLLRQLASQGFRHVTLAVGHLAEMVQLYCGDGSRFGVEISYTVEEEPLGTIGPLALVTGLDDTFLVMNGDLLTTLPFRELRDAHRRSSCVATLAVIRRRVELEFGVVEFDGAVNNALSKITGFQEKPALESIVSMGVYAFEPAVLDYIDPGEPLDLPELIDRLLAAGRDIGAFTFDGYWLDLGRHSDYSQAVEEFEVLRPQLLGAEGATTLSPRR